MIHAAIVEDEKSYQEQLKRYIRKYEAESGQKVHLRVFNDGDEIIDHYAGNYDIIFLDIEMRRMNGSGPQDPEAGCGCHIDLYYQYGTVCHTGI